MAWTAQAWRYSLLGLPDPAQSLDEQQTQLALAGVANSSDLAFIVPWDYDESLTLTFTPLGTTGFDVTTRYAIAGVAAVGLGDSINRDGVVAATLATFAPDLDGTSVLPTFEGDIAVTLAGFSASFTAEFQNRLYFDVGYSITPAFIIHEQPARFGDLSATLAGFSLVASGSVLPPGAIDGQANLSVAAFSTGLTGTFTAAPARDGNIGLDIEVFGVSLAGVSTPAQSNIGFVAATVDALSTNFDGTFAPWTTDGVILVAVDAFSVSMEGAVISAGANVGQLSASIDDLLVGLYGTAKQSDSQALAFVVEPESQVFRVSPEKRTFVVTPGRGGFGL